MLGSLNGQGNKLFAFGCLILFSVLLFVFRGDHVEVLFFEGLITSSFTALMVLLNTAIKDSSKS